MLPALYVASTWDPQGFSTFIGFVLLLPPGFTFAVAGVLIWTSRQAPDVETLRERADDATTAALQSLGAALVGAVVLATNVAHITIPGKPALALLAWVCLLIGVPALGWLAAWRRHWLPLLRLREANAVTAAAMAQGADPDPAEVPPPL